jgi:hypothetical protein
MAKDEHRMDHLGLQHDRAAMVHEAAARYWHRRGDDDRAALEGELARRDIEEAELERERSELEDGPDDAPPVTDGR